MNCRITTQSLSSLRSVAGAHVSAVKQLSRDTILRLKEGQQEDYKTACPTEIQRDQLKQLCFTTYVVINMKSPPFWSMFVILVMFCHFWSCLSFLVIFVIFGVEEKGDVF